MICLVLAAGYATRLYPLTENFPKPLLSIKGKPILNWLLDDIDCFDEITEHVIISNHKFSNIFYEWQKKQNYNKPLTILDDGSTDNNNRLGAVNDIKLAIDKLNITEDMLVIAGDNVLDFSFKDFIDFFNIKGASCVMCHEENVLEKLQKTAVISIDDNDFISAYEEKPKEPKGNLAVPPFYCYKACDVRRIDEALDNGCGSDSPGAFAAWLSKQTPMYAYNMPGKRYDIGDIHSYEYVKSVFNK